MGYTHYWTLKKSANDPARFKEAVELFKELWDEAPKTYTADVWDKKAEAWKTKRFKKENLLKGGLGEGDPVITDTCIRFNGDAKYDLDHETFCLDLADFTAEDGYNRKENGDVLDFCKTARKPYDLAVCLALMAFKDVFGDDFEYSSDGVTRENLKDPDCIAYWERNGLDPDIEHEWKRAYKVYDNYMLDMLDLHIKPTMAR